MKTFATNEHFGLVVIARGAGNGLNGAQREATSDTASAPDPKPLGRLSLASFTIMEQTY